MKRRKKEISVPRILPEKIGTCLYTSSNDSLWYFNSFWADKLKGERIQRGPTSLRLEKFDFPQLTNPLRSAWFVEAYILYIGKPLEPLRNLTKVLRSINIISLLSGGKGNSNRGKIPRQRTVTKSQIPFPPFLMTNFIGPLLSDPLFSNQFTEYHRLNIYIAV